MRFCPYGCGGARGTNLGGSSSGEGGRSRVCDGGRLASTFGIINDELQQSANDEIRQSGGGATR
jgi:hypothetical protein